MKKFIFLLLVPFIFSCTSLQKDVHIEQISYDEEIIVFEQRFSSIDANSFIVTEDLNEKLQKEQKIEDFIFDVEQALSNNSLKKSAQARLFALEGKAQLILGNKLKAKSLYEKSVDSYKGDTQAVILANRLGLLKDIKSIEDEIDSVAEKELILLESALVCYNNKKYVDSVAKFDESFLSLDEFYRSSYGKIRDLAWKFRDIDTESEIADLLPLSKITISQMLTIAKSKSDFLYNLAGGKKMSSRAFFNKIASLGLLNPVSKPLDEKNAVGEGDIVTKKTSARFLWNLYNVKRNSSNQLTKYSSRMKKSPVSDLSFEDSDFDAVLGCVENEFMSLEDGKNFLGEKPVSAIEFNKSISNIE